MKAIIVEIKGNHAAVLSDDGLVSKIRNKNYTIGQEITIKNKSNKLIKITAAAAAAIMIFVTPAWAYLTPYSYVSLDVNPSFEFYINRFDRVLTVKALNDDGRELSKDINIEGLKNKEIQSAVRNVLNELKNKGYIIEGDESGVIVATSSKSEEKTDILFEKMQTAVYEIELNQEENNPIKEKAEDPKKAEKAESGKETVKQDRKIHDDDIIDEAKETEKPEKQEKPYGLKEREKEAKEREKEHEKREKEREKEQEKQEKERVKEEKEQEKKDKPDRKTFNGNVIEVTKEEVDLAKELGVTPGKYNLIGKLKDAASLAGDEIEAGDWLDKSVQEINSQIKKYREEIKEKEEKEDNKNKNKNKAKDASPDRDKRIENNNDKDKKSGKGQGKKE